MFLDAPTLLTCKVNIELVKLTVGVPHIVPLELTNCNPSGSSGTICHEIILPLISEGTIGDIGVPLSNINSVSLYVTVGLPLPIPNEILKNIFLIMEKYYLQELQTFVKKNNVNFLFQ